jgi:hypothetical protein
MHTLSLLSPCLPPPLTQVTKPFYHEKHGSCMILSVDDDLINQYVVEELLTLEGYKVRIWCSHRQDLFPLSPSLVFLSRTRSSLSTSLTRHCAAPLLSSSPFPPLLPVHRWRRP